MGVFAGIGRPEGLARTLTAFRRAPADTFWWPDHHVYTRADVNELIAWARDAHLDALVTTEKDAVKLARLEVDWPVPVAALRIEIEFWGQGSMILDRLIDEMLEEYAHGNETRGEEERPEEPTEEPPQTPPC
jgi:tetraacyldisaccharide 4'-kinase